MTKSMSVYPLIPLLPFPRHSERRAGVSDEGTVRVCVRFTAIDRIRRGDTCSCF